MHPVVALVAGIWITMLLVVMVVYATVAKSSATRIVALDALSLLLVALLVLYSASVQRSYYLDAALALALVSFIGPIAAARWRSNRRIL
ncbi:MAG: monovalent cation/H+ antiporter complex subunit F [Thermomicrobiales bacterium]